jgi:hypothetical protein
MANLGNLRLGLVSSLPIFLNTMVMNYTTSFALDTLSPVMAELPPVVSKADLHVAQFTLNLLARIRQAIPIIQKTAVLKVLKSVVSAGVSGSDILSVLVNPVLGGDGGSLQKQSIPNSLTFSLLEEIGCRADLSHLVDLKSAIHTNEEVKTAASYDLGNIALVNLAEDLSLILPHYLLFLFIKEVISTQSVSPSGVQVLSGYSPSIWDQLYKHTECVDEGTKNVVAQCIGKLCLMSPDALLPKMKASLNSPSSLMRTMSVTAMKFTLSDKPHLIDQLFRAEIGHFPTKLKHPDQNVRRAAHVAFCSAGHKKPSLISLREKSESEVMENARLIKGRSNQSRSSWPEHLQGCRLLGGTPVLSTNTVRKDTVDPYEFEEEDDELELFRGFRSGTLVCQDIVFGILENVVKRSKENKLNDIFNKVLNENQNEIVNTQKAENKLKRIFDKVLQNADALTRQDLKKPKKSLEDVFAEVIGDEVNDDAALD